MLIHIPRSPDANIFVSFGLSVPVNYSQGEVLNQAFRAHQQHRPDIMPQNFSRFWAILFFKKHIHKEQSLLSIKWCHVWFNTQLRLWRSALTALTERNPVKMGQPVETSHFRLAPSNRLTHSHTRKATRSWDDATLKLHCSAERTCQS